MACLCLSVVFNEVICERARVSQWKRTYMLIWCMSAFNVGCAVRAQYTHQPSIHSIDNNSHWFHYYRLFVLLRCTRVVHELEQAVGRTQNSTLDYWAEPSHVVTADTIRASDIDDRETQWKIYEEMWIMTYGIGVVACGEQSVENPAERKICLWNITHAYVHHGKCCAVAAR